MSPSEEVEEIAELPDKDDVASTFWQSLEYIYRLRKYSEKIASLSSAFYSISRRTGSEDAKALQQDADSCVGALEGVIRSYVGLLTSGSMYMGLLRLFLEDLDAQKDILLDVAQNWRGRTVRSGRKLIRLKVILVAQLFEILDTKDYFSKLETDLGKQLGKGADSGAAKAIESGAGANKSPEALSRFENELLPNSITAEGFPSELNAPHLLMVELLTIRDALKEKRAGLEESPIGQPKRKQALSLIKKSGKAISVLRVVAEKYKSLVHNIYSPRKGNYLAAKRNLRKSLAGALTTLNRLCVGQVVMQGEMGGIKRDIENICGVAGKQIKLLLKPGMFPLERLSRPVNDTHAAKRRKRVYESLESAMKNEFTPLSLSEAITSFESIPKNPPKQYKGHDGREWRKRKSEFLNVFYAQINNFPLLIKCREILFQKAGENVGSMYGQITKMMCGLGLNEMSHDQLRKALPHSPDAVVHGLNYGLLYAVAKLVSEEEASMKYGDTVSGFEAEIGHNIEGRGGPSSLFAVAHLLYKVECALTRYELEHFIGKHINYYSGLAKTLFIRENLCVPGAQGQIHKLTIFTLRGHARKISLRRRLVENRLMQSSGTISLEEEKIFYTKPE